MHDWNELWQMEMGGDLFPPVLSNCTAVLRQWETGVLQIMHGNKQTNKQTNMQTNKQTNKHANKQTDRQTDKQTCKQTNKQTDRQTNRLKTVQLYHPCMVYNITTGLSQSDKIMLWSIYTKWVSITHLNNKFMKYSYLLKKQLMLEFNVFRSLKI